MLIIILRVAVVMFGSRRSLVLENLALRHQIQVLRLLGPATSLIVAGSGFLGAALDVLVWLAGFAQHRPA